MKSHTNPSPTLNMFTLLASALCCWMLPLTPSQADDHTARIKHSLFIAGPTFTGIIDEDGKEVWSTRKAARDGYVLDNGHTLIAWLDEVVEFDPNKKRVWTYKLDKSNKEIGSVQRLPDGNTAITELGANPRLLEVARDGSIAMEVKLQPETDDVHKQTRMARKLPNGNYLVPHLLAFAIKEYKPDGTVVHALRTDTEHFGGRETRHWPFTAIRTPATEAHPKGTTVVGCTQGRRVVELDYDGKVVWELTNEEAGGIIHGACGVQRLPNGNTVVASYAQKKADAVKLFEVTRDKKVVWTINRPRVHHFQILTTNGKPIKGTPMK